MRHSLSLRWLGRADGQSEPKFHLPSERVKERGREVPPLRSGLVHLLCMAGYLWMVGGRYVHNCIDRLIESSVLLQGDSEVRTGDPVHQKNLSWDWPPCEPPIRGVHGSLI